MRENKPTTTQVSGKNYIHIQKKYFNTIYQENNLDKMLGSWAGEAYKSVFFNITQVLDLQQRSYQQTAKNRNQQANQNSDDGTYPRESGEMLFSKRNEWDNNIIAITGGRGSGKSSTLNNVVNYLRGKEVDADFCKEAGFSSKGSSICGTIITCLGILDPTLFNDSDIMEVVISWLFRMFKEKLLKNEKTDTEAKRKILKEFEDIYKYLGTIRRDNGKRMDGDYIETLDILSSTTKLKYLLNDLIALTLSFLHKNQDESNGKAVAHRLLIALDDFDQEYANAYKTLEFIRKYLMIPNVIVLIGANIEDLHSFIAKTMYAELKITKELDKEAFSRAETMSLNYLQKVIPEAHRIPMPTFNNFGKATLLFIEDIDDEEFKNFSDRSNKDDVSAYRERFGYTNRIVRLIYQKAGVLLLPDAEHIQLFNYMSLRDINGLIELLQDADEKNGHQVNTCNKLLDYLYRWFFKGVVKDSQPHYKKQLDDILNTGGYRRNKLWVKLYNRLLMDISSANDLNTWLRRDRLGEYGELYNSIIDPLNNPYNVSYADVAKMKGRIQHKEDTDDQRRVVMFCEVMQSIQCYTQYASASMNESSIPFYQGLITHDNLATLNRDCIYIDDIKKLNKGIKRLAEQYGKKGSNDRVGLVMDQFNKAKELFDKFIYYRYPYPTTGIKESISNQTDQKVFYDEDIEGNYEKVVFSVQAYMLKHGFFGALALGQRELIEYMMEKAKLRLKQSSTYVVDHLCEIFVRIGNSLTDARVENITPPEDLLIAKIVKNIHDSEFMDLMQQAGQVKMILQRGTLEVKRKFSYDESEKEILSNMVIILTSLITKDSKDGIELDPLLDAIETTLSDSTMSFKIQLIRFLWFVALFQLILELQESFVSGKDSKSTVDSKGKVTDFDGYYQLVTDRIRKVQSHKNAAGVLTRSSTTISIDLTELRQGLENVQDKGSESAIFSSSIFKKLEDLRAKMNELRRPADSVSFVGDELTWFIDGLQSIKDELEAYLSGRS